MTDITPIAATAGLSALCTGSVAVVGIVLRDRLGRRTADRQLDVQEQSADAAQVQGLVAIITAQRVEMRAATEERNDLRRDMAELRDVMEKLIESQRTEDTEHEHQLQRLHTTVSALRTEVDNHATSLITQAEQHKRQMAEKDRQIAELQSGIAERDRRIDGLTAQMAQLRKQVEAGGARLQGEAV